MRSPDPTSPLRSFIDVAADSDFPIWNIPFGVFQRLADEKPQVGTRIGDFVLDLKKLEHAGLFRDTPLGEDHVFCKWSLNKFMARGPAVRRAARERIIDLLRHDTPRLRDDAPLRDDAIVPADHVRMLLPVEIPGFVDFYASKDHATNVGIMFRGPENALMPNWLHLPVAYNGRASSVVVSGIDFHRPCGQTRADDAALPSFGPSRMVDFEMEVGFIAAVPSQWGRPVPADRAMDHVFGLVLLNDWSARDVQRWEYQPLGPFLGKSFATSISPWVVTLDALEPFRVAPPPQDPPILPYLRTACDWAYDVRVEAWLQTPRMSKPMRISGANFRGMYWTVPQMLAHMTVNGCNINTGDLFGSGTISGPTDDSRGSLLELAWKGTRPLTLPTGESRASLQDGDTLILRGYCQHEPQGGPAAPPESAGYRIGFGECRATVLPAVM